MKFLTKCQNICYRGGLFLKEKSPTIFMVTGIGLICYTIYKSNERTAHIEPIKRKHNANMDIIHENEHKAEVDPEHYAYSEKQKSQDLFEAYRSYSWDLIKHYKAPIATGVLGMTFVIAAYCSISRKYAASMAVTAGLERAFRAYRDNVIADQGIEADRKYMYGLEKETVVETVKNEDGTDHVVEHTILKANNMSVYSRVFDETNMNFDIKNPEGNKDFLRGQQEWWNLQLDKRGYVFLNDIYKALGFNETVAGTRVGWLKDPDPELGGDGYICFEIINNIITGAGAMNKDFVNCNPYSNGEAPEVLLDFNVDGDILAVLEKRGYFKAV